ncbi:MAG: hypothetical protein JNL01_13435 [Bdellovibrionales bacterium]|nr:hypothetical protein [Bdellovibrionales bacterium]
MKTFCGLIALSLVTLGPTAPTAHAEGEACWKKVSKNFGERNAVMKKGFKCASGTVQTLVAQQGLPSQAMNKDIVNTNAPKATATYCVILGNKLTQPWFKDEKECSKSPDPQPGAAPGMHGAPGPKKKKGFLKKIFKKNS